MGRSATPSSGVMLPELLVELPELTAPGHEQMQRDERLLEDAHGPDQGGRSPDETGRTPDEAVRACHQSDPEAAAVVARRYLWDPPCLSLGRFQRAPTPDGAGGRPSFEAGGGLPFEVVRRPSGGRAVLHGREFEWSFAVLFREPPGAVMAGDANDRDAARSRRGVAAPYEVVGAAMAAALASLGVPLEGCREQAYQRSALCFASSLRYDLSAGSGKIVAVAQARRGRAALVHGSVLERRPPRALVAAVEQLLGEAWQGEGLAAETPAPPDGRRLWQAFLEELRRLLGRAA